MGNSREGERKLFEKRFPFPLPAPSPNPSKTFCKMDKEVGRKTADLGERHTCQSRTAGAFLGKSFALSPTPPLPLQKLPVKWARRSKVELPIWENATRAKAAPQVPFWEKGFLSPSCTHPNPSKTSQKKALTNFEFCNHFY